MAGHLHRDVVRAARPHGAASPAGRRRGGQGHRVAARTGPVAAGVGDRQRLSLGKGRWKEMLSTSWNQSWAAPGVGGSAV